MRGFRPGKRAAFSAATLLLGYGLLVLSDLAIYKFGYRTPFLSTQMRDLYFSQDVFDLSNNPRYRRWLKAFVMPENQGPWKVQPGDAARAYGLQNDNPTVSFPGTDAQGWVNIGASQEAEVLFLGDSFVQGAGAGFADSIPVAFEAISGLHAYRMAVGGYGLPHYLELLRHAVAERHTLFPKLQAVEVVVYIGNDLAQDMDAFRMRETEDGAGSRLRLRSMEKILMINLEPLVTRVHRLHRVTEPATPSSSWCDNVVRLDAYKGKRIVFHPFHRTFRDLGWLTDARRAWIDQILAEMKSLARDAGLQLHFTLLPTTLQCFAPFLLPKSAGLAGEFDRVYPGIVANEDRLLAYLRERLTKSQLPVLDMRPVLDAHLADERLFWENDTHYAGRGHQLVARTIHQEFYEGRRVPGTPR